MRFSPKDPPRLFTVGNSVKFQIKDCGTIYLDADEQVTFVTASGSEYDVTAKDWGFYATPSLNGRLQQFGLRGVLIRNWFTGNYFVLLVAQGQEAKFDAYCQQENLVVVTWLDNNEALDRLATALDKLDD
jgi:hypothetical protein